MIGNYWYETKIPTTNALAFNIKDYCLNNLDQSSLLERYKKMNSDDQGNIKNALWVFDNPDYFVNQEWKREVQRKFPEFDLIKFLVFYKGPNVKNIVAHVDRPYNKEDYEEGKNQFDTTVGFNWVLDEEPEGNQMIWFEPIGDFENQFVSEGRGAGYYMLPREYLKEVDRKCLRNDLITLTKVDSFHEVDTVNQERWCITLRMPEFWNNWQELYKYLQELGLVHDR